MSKEIYIPTQETEDHLKALRVSVKTVDVTRREQERIGNKNVFFPDEYNNIIFPPPDFQYNGGVEKLLEMISGGIVGLVNELGRPLNSRGNPRNDREMKKVVHETIESAKREVAENYD